MYQLQAASRETGGFGVLAEELDGAGLPVAVAETRELLPGLGERGDGEVVVAVAGMRLAEVGGGACPAPGAEGGHGSAQPCRGDQLVRVADAESVRR